MNSLDFVSISDKSEAALSTLCIVTMLFVLVLLFFGSQRMDGWQLKVMTTE
jgi:hypothetical protein